MSTILPEDSEQSSLPKASGRFIRLYEDVMGDRRLGAQEFRILASLMWAADYRTGTVSESHRQIADRACCDHSDVSKRIAKLVELGYVEVRSVGSYKSRKPSVYYLPRMVSQSKKQVPAAAQAEPASVPAVAPAAPAKVEPGLAEKEEVTYGPAVELVARYLVNMSRKKYGIELSKDRLQQYAKPLDSQFASLLSEGEPAKEALKKELRGAVEVVLRKEGNIKDREAYLVGVISKKLEGPQAWAKP